MHPYYTIMKLPGESGPEYIQMLPFTPRGKDNLAAWMVARSDGANYGKLAVFQFPEADGHLRTAPGRGAHQPGPGDLAADHAVEPAGIGSHPGHAAGHPDRGVADLHPSALPEGGGRPDPRAQARHRRLSEQHRDGGDARARRSSGSSPAAPRPQPQPRRSRVQPAAARLSKARRRHRRMRARSPSRRAPTTSARSRRSATATGRSTARRSRSSAKSWRG